jgi:hypothetical protein
MVRDGRIPDETFLRAGVDDFVGQEFPPVLGVVATGGGAFDRFGQRRLVGLTRRQGHQIANFSFVAFKDFGGLRNALSTKDLGRLTFGVEYTDRKLEVLLNFSLGQGLGRLDDFSGSTIDCGDGILQGSLRFHLLLVRLRNRMRTIEQEDSNRVARAKSVQTQPLSRHTSIIGHLQKRRRMQCL